MEKILATKLNLHWFVCSQGLFPVLCLASLSHNCVQWLITVIPLWLQQHHVSLVLKNWHWHISSFLRRFLTVLPPLQDTPGICLSSAHCLQCAMR